MSTPSFVGRFDHRAKTLTGVYVNWDGYPSYMGPTLLDLAGRLGPVSLTESLLASDAWSSLAADTDCFRVEPAATTYSADRFHIVDGLGVSYRDGEPTAGPWPVSTPLESMYEYAYGIDAERRRLMIFDNRSRRPEARARRVASLPLSSNPAAVDWAKIECGADFARCSHVAGAHATDLTPEASRVPMQVYLGRRNPAESDALAVEVGGRLYRRPGTASAGSSDIRPASIAKAVAEGRLWIQSYSTGRVLGPRRYEYWCWVNAVADDGTTVPLLPVTRVGQRDKPLPGVTFVLPRMAQTA